MHIRKFLITSLIAVLAAACSVEKSYWKDRPVVKVEKFSLTSKEFANRLVRKLKIFDALSAKDASIVDRAKSEVVEEYIVEVITSGWAQKRNILIRKEELDKAVNKIKFSYPDELSFKRALANEGTTYKDWRDQMRFKLLQQKVFNEIVKEIKPAKLPEMKDYFKKNKGQFVKPARVKLRQILLESENNAQRILKQLRRGVPLAKLAEKYSIAPEAKEKGIIGWIEKGTLAIYDKAFGMRIGQRSKVLKSAYGYHIFEIMNKKNRKKLKFDQAKSTIKQMLLENKQQSTYANWIEEQLRATKVFKDEKLLKAIGVNTSD